MLRSSYKTVGLFLLLIVVLLLGANVTYQATARIAASEASVTHTYEVMSAIDSLIFSLQRAQNSASDFVATGQREYLNGYQASVQRIGPAIQQIRTLTIDNPEQHRAIAEVETKSVELKAFLDNAIDYRSRGLESQPTGEQTRTVVEDLQTMKTRESNLLNQRSVEAALNLRTTRLGLLTGALINGALLLWGAYLIVRDQKQQSEIKKSRLRLASIVDSSQDAILSKTLDGTITSWNSGAEQLYGYKAEEMIGKSIYEIVPEDRKDELRMILERLGRGGRIEYLETVRLCSDGTPIEVELTVSPLKDDQGKVIEASAIGRDITERKLLERSMQQLSVRILRAQDEERRRIAREIHDTTVQKLALLSMNMAQLKGNVNPVQTRAMIENSAELTSQCVQELRTLSYVLHPPMLDELGLPSALKIYVEGITQRSGISIVTDFDPGVQRMSPEVEIALFRVAQESLGNVLRHSGSQTARLRLFRENGIVMTISDEGKGIPEHLRSAETPAKIGVGILGMNERMRQLGGGLTVDSGPGGTTVTAHIPEMATNAAKRA